MNGVMKILNTSKNTIYIEELDLYLPFTNEPQFLETDSLKRSRSLRNAIIQGILEVIEYNPNERIEASVVYLHKTHNPQKQEEPAKSEEIQEEPEETILNSATNNIEVKFHGIFFDGGGYAKVNRNLVQKLSQAGIKIKVDPKHCQNELTEKELAPIKKLMQTSLSKNHISIDSVIPSFGEYSSSKYPILYTTVESYTIPKQFIECCQFYREIHVTSPFAKSILEQYVKDKPIYVIPAGSDPELYCEYGPKFDFKPNIKNFVFLSVFGWSYRKGYDVLLKAYFEEFSASEDVSLLIASRYQNGTSRFHKEKIKDDINKIVKEFPNKDLPHVVRYSQMISEYQMPQLYRSAHCFVLPSRGESSCLTSPEASLCGLPVIMTNVSGQCVPSGTRIDTVNGAQKIGDITTEDYVISHTGEARKVTHKFTRQYSGNILRIKSYGNDDLLITHEHPVLVEDPTSNIQNFIPAKEIKKGDYLVYPRNFRYHRSMISLSDFIKETQQIEKIDGGWKLRHENRRKGALSVSEVSKIIGVAPWKLYHYLKHNKIDDTNIQKINHYIASHGEINKPPVRISDRIELDYEFGILGGFYLSESSTRVDTTTFHLNLNEDAYARQISDIIKRKFDLDCVFIKNSTRHTLDVKVYSTLFRIIFEGLFGKICDNKSPGILTFYNCREFQKGLLVGQLQGDGCRRSSYWDISTTSPHIAVGVRRSFMHFDIPTTIKSRVRKNRRKSYEVRVSSKYAEMLDQWMNTAHGPKKYHFHFILMGSDNICFPVRSVTEEKYTGELSNLEIEGDNSYIANGVSVHNCMYLREDNAFLVDMDYLEEIKQGQMHLHYWNNQKFPALKERKVIEQLRQHMRYVFNNIEKAKEKNKNLQKLIKQNFTWTHTANAAIERLKEIKGTL